MTEKHSCHLVRSVSSLVDALVLDVHGGCCLGSSVLRRGSCRLVVLTAGTEIAVVDLGSCDLELGEEVPVDSLVEVDLMRMVRKCDMGGRILELLKRAIASVAVVELEIAVIAVAGTQQRRKEGPA